jgi:hypothetical protein
MPTARAGASAYRGITPLISIGLDVAASYSKPTGMVLPRYLASVVKLEANVVLGFGL